MLFSARDIDILKLLRWCRLIRSEDLVSTFSEPEVFNLKTCSLIKLHHASASFVLTTKGNRLLNEVASDLPPATPPAYKEADTIRRLHLSQIMLAAYSAGLDVFALHPDTLGNNRSLFLPALSRGRGTNPWGSTRVAAITHIGDYLCAVHYVRLGIGKLSLNDELAAFHNNTAQLSSLQRCLIFSGAGYTDILSELESEETISDTKLSSYGDAYRLLTLPVFLVPCDRTGITQLQILSVPDHRRKLTQAALKSQYAPPPKSFPLCDAFFQHTPFLMAVDMDLRRIDAAIEAAHTQGYDQISLAALPAQCNEVLYSRYRDTGKARVFALTDAALRYVLGETHAPLHAPYYTNEGDVVHVPLIKTP